jgi:glutamate/aspartate transport system permease protein
MNYSWNWGVLVQNPYAQWLVWGVAMTMTISLAAMAIALVIGTGIGVLRSSNNRIAKVLTSI